MDRQPVQSSSIKSVGYDADTRTLEIEFPSGAVYHHYDVPPEAHQALMSAESVGKHYGAHIRWKRRYKKLAAHVTALEKMAATIKE